MDDAYTWLIEQVEKGGARYRLIDHSPEGRTDLVSAARGHESRQAAKCMILIVKIGKRVTKYVLAVVPGDSRVDLAAIKKLLAGTYVSFASPAIAEQLTGCVVGTILPFALTEELQVIVDPSLLENDEIYFNAARLDRSMVLKTEDYLALVHPQLERIAVRDSNP
jgi:Ala-tRNA(Pro) deacylase